jgi:phosphate transport system permease protein
MNPVIPARSVHTTAAAKLRLQRRRRANIWIQVCGLAAIGVAVFALVTLVWTIGSKAVNAVYEYRVALVLDIDKTAFETEEAANAAVERSKSRIERGLTTEEAVRQTAERVAVFDVLNGATAQALGALVADFPRRAKRRAHKLLSGGNTRELYAVYETGGFFGAIKEAWPHAAILSDDAQLYFKGAFGKLEALTIAGDATPSGVKNDVVIASNRADFSAIVAAVKSRLRAEREKTKYAAGLQENAIKVTNARLNSATEEEKEKLLKAKKRYEDKLVHLSAKISRLTVRIDDPNSKESLTKDDPSYFVRINGGLLKATEVSATALSGLVVQPLTSDAAAAAGDWDVRMMARPESSRKISDNDIMMLESFRDQGLIQAAPNFGFWTQGDSRKAELAGVKGALLGSLFTMVVTFLIAFPIGVMAAIYLEEFAPKNWFTNIIEVNINNLAAIPSIIFGLFGLLLLLSGFYLPIGADGVMIGGWFKEYRSAAFIGGMVLALMTLPTIIIASRASIRAVPPSIRQAALGVGASKNQTVFHHILPLAMPGMMTGAIIGMAQALGETAPLLMVGMVGFFVDAPTGVSDPTAVLPAILYFWSDYPEKLFEFKTSLAIVTLLIFLVAMNALAVLLRRHFERRW